MERHEQDDRELSIGDADTGGRTAALAEADESIFDLLSARARNHSRGHLLLATVIGGIDAVALGWAHPALWPLATLFGAAGAYGAWGLADRALTDQATGAGRPHRRSTDFAIRVARNVAAIVGVAAAVAAFAGIWVAAIGEWHH